MKPWAPQGPRPVLPFGPPTTAGASQRSASVRGATAGAADVTSSCMVAVATYSFLHSAFDRFEVTVAGNPGPPRHGDWVRNGSATKRLGAGTLHSPGLTLPCRTPPGQGLRRTAGARSLCRLPATARVAA